MIRERQMRTNCVAGGAVVALVALASGSLPSQAAARRSVVTSIRNADCRFDRRDGPGSEEAQRKRCPGLAGGRVVVDASGTTVALGFDWATGSVRRQRRVVVGWSLGGTLDWRGTGAGAAFRPDGVILRVLFNRDDGPRVGHQVLAVMHVRPGQACLRAVVDMAANAAPDAIARRVADDPSPFACGRDAPRTAGTPTEWTRRVIDRSGTVPD